MAEEKEKNVEQGQSADAQEKTKGSQEKEKKKFVNPFLAYGLLAVEFVIILVVGLVVSHL